MIVRAEAVANVMTGRSMGDDLAYALVEVARDADRKQNRNLLFRASAAAYSCSRSGKTKSLSLALQAHARAKLRLSRARPVADESLILAPASGEIRAEVLHFAATPYLGSRLGSELLRESILLFERLGLMYWADLVRLRLAISLWMEGDRPLHLLQRPTFRWSVRRDPTLAWCLLNSTAICALAEADYASAAQAIESMGDPPNRDAAAKHLYVRGALGLLTGSAASESIDLIQEASRLGFDLAQRLIATESERRLDLLIAQLKAGPVADTCQSVA